MDELRSCLRYEELCEHHEEKPNWTLAYNSPQSAEPITVFGYAYPPYTEACFNETNCAFPGFEMKLLRTILGGVGYLDQVEYRRVRSEWEMVSAVAGQRNAMTGVTASLNFTERFPNLTALPLLLVDRAVYIVKPGFQDILAANILFSVTKYGVWAAFLGSFAGIAVLRALLGRRAAVLRAAAAAWFFCLGLILALYSNFLAVSLGQPVPEAQLFNTYGELAALLYSGRCRALLYSPAENSTIILLGALDPVTTKVARLTAAVELMQAAFKRNPPLLMEDGVGISRAVAHSADCRVGVTFDSGARFVHRQRCGLRVIRPPDALTSRFTFLVNRDSHFVRAVRLFLLKGISPSELYAEEQRRYERELRFRSVEPECVDGNAGDDSFSRRRRPLNVAQILDLLWMSLVSLLAAGFVGLVERLFPTFCSNVRWHRGDYSLD